MSFFSFATTEGYSNSFFFCCADPISCLAVFCVPCLAIGWANGKLSNTGFDVPSCCCASIGAYRLRRKVQSNYGITEAEDASVCAIGCCTMCSAVQDIHELRKRESATAPQPQMKTGE